MGEFFPELSDSDYLSEIGQYTRDLRAILEQPWQVIPMESGWTVYTGGGGYDTSSLRARKLGNILQLTGMIKNAAATAGGTNSRIGYLPSSLWPERSVIIPAASNAYAAISIGNADGGLSYYSGPNNPTFVSINWSFAIDNGP